MGSPIRSPGGNGIPGSNQNPGNRSNPVPEGFAPQFGDGEQFGEVGPLPDVNGPEGLGENSSRIDEIAITILSPSEAVPRFFVCGEGDSPEESDIGFICGGNTTRQECQAAAVQIYSVCAQPIDVIHNSALTEWSSIRVTESDPRVRALQSSWDAYFTRHSNPDLLRLQICTGDATFIVREALRNYQYSGRIIIIAFAPSCMIPDDLCFQVVHYRSSWDIISAQRGTSSRSQQTLIVPRHPESRGLLDHEVMSSTFFLIMEMETLCFYTRQVLVETGVFPPGFNRDWCLLRNFFLYDNAPNFQTRERRRRGALASFLARYPTVTIPVVTPVNLWESCLSEVPRNGLERFIRSVVIIRNYALWATTVNTFSLYQQVIPNRVWPLVVLDALLLSRLEFLNLRRVQDGGSVWRTLALRSQWFDVVQWFYELVILGSLPLDPTAPGFLYAILGVRVVFTGITLTSQNLVTFVSPLRGRIDSHWRPLDEGDIHTETTENRPAMRAGLVRRIGRAAVEITRNVAGLAVTGILIYTALFPPEVPFSEDSTDLSPTPPTDDDEFALSGILGIISGILSAASLVQNVIQWGRSARQLRNDDIPRDETVPRAVPEEIELHALGGENVSDSDSESDDEERRLLPDD